MSSRNVGNCQPTLGNIPEGRRPQHEDGPQDCEVVQIGTVHTFEYAEGTFPIVGRRRQRGAPKRPRLSVRAHSRRIL